MPIAVSPFAIQSAQDRFCADHGWLRTAHSFSFADYNDPSNVNWGALRVFNDDRVAPGTGFPTHPHQNMEILTYVLDGTLEHRDTLGSHGIVEAGGVQYLSAGNGLRHSEYNASAERELHFVQMWVLPGELNTAPTYGQVDFAPAARRDRWLAVASGQTATDAPIRLTQSATLRVAGLADARVDYTFETGRLGFLFVATGNPTVDGTGSVTVDAVDIAGRSHRATLGNGDAVRMIDIVTLEVAGTGELVFWDVPPVNRAR